MNNISIIGAPCDLGGACPGSRLGPDALRVAGLIEALQSLNISLEDKGNLTHPVIQWQQELSYGYRHLKPLIPWISSLKTAVLNAFEEKSFPLTIGGDHSLAMGSIFAASQWAEKQGKQLKVLWFDAHADFNTKETSPTGNIHGMPLAVLTGEGESSLVNLGHKLPSIEAKNITMVGLRSVDPLEKKRLLDHGVATFDMRDLDQRGLETIMDQILSGFSKDQDHLHVSFDVDVLDVSIAKGVSTPAWGGMTFREIRYAFEKIYETALMTSLDIFEVNPLKDDGNQTAEIAVSLVPSLFGARLT